MEFTAKQIADLLGGTVLGNEKRKREHRYKKLKRAGRGVYLFGQPVCYILQPMLLLFW